MSSLTETVTDTIAETRPVPPSAGRQLPSYLPWIDVLRFLACFLVIVLHSVPGAPAALGHAGVALFFSISGFLIGRVLLENRQLSRFYARRFLRIYPAYFTAIALLVLFSFTPLLHDSGVRPLVLRNLGYYLTFTFQLSPEGSRLPLMIVWSLCVEELFYLLLPLVFRLERRPRIACAMLAVIALLLVPRFYLLPNGGGAWYLFPLNLFFGVLLALARPNLRSTWPWLGVVAVSLTIANAFTGWYHSFGPVSAFACTTAVWSLAASDRKLPRVLEPVRWMGTLSYGMYLLHLFCLSAALRVIRSLAPQHALYLIATVMLTTGLTVLISWLLQVGVEDPALRLRPALKSRPALRYLLAAVQVSLIPLGILLALLHRRP